MDRTGISTELAQFVRANILDDGVSLDDQTILANIGIDSFSLMEIILFIERKFGVVLPEDELTPNNLQSIDTIANCVHQHLPS